MIEEKPRKAFYQIECRECQKPTPHGLITEGLCPDCYAPTEAAADVFNAMLKAMPLEQKRAILRNL